MRRPIFLLSTLTALAALLLMTVQVPAEAQTYMPDESAPHEGTWLQWPHHYTYGVGYRNPIESTWVAMVAALVDGENVHIIAYNSNHRRRIKRKLRAAGVPLDRVDFLIARTDDTWVRDNGPIFVYDQEARLQLTDWRFNGWGFDAPYRRDDRVPRKVAQRTGLSRVPLGNMVLEGGAIEVDGRGTLMATRSSILEPNRNPGLTQARAEEILRAHLGVHHFVWLDGAPGGAQDITDTHIDGFARFGTPDVIVTMRDADLSYWGLSGADISRLRAARDADGRRYEYVELPLTRRNVVTTYGRNLGIKGSYVNFYVANRAVLVPQYGDPNDTVALRILRRLYPERRVVGIDVRNLYRWGGMVHCVTQQQPIRP